MSSMLQTPRRTEAGKPILSALCRHLETVSGLTPRRCATSGPADELALPVQANGLASPYDVVGELHADERERLVDLVTGRHRGHTSSRAVWGSS
jgi:hypothetical protein